MPVNLDSSGSLIILHHACNSYDSTLFTLDTGGSMGEETGHFPLCNQWDTTIEIPSVEFFVRTSTYVTFSSMAAIATVIVVFWLLRGIFRFFFNILVRKK